MQPARRFSDGASMPQPLQQASSSSGGRERSGSVVLALAQQTESSATEGNEELADLSTEAKGWLGQRGYRWSDLLYVVPLVGIILGTVSPSQYTDRGGVAVVEDRQTVAEAVGLLSALLLAIIGAAYVSLEAEELAQVNLWYTIGPYGCVSKSDPGTEHTQINLEGELVGIGLAALCLSLLALFTAILAIIGVSTVRSNKNRTERKRFWQWGWVFFAVSIVSLVGATALSAWYFLKIYMLKYPITVFEDLCNQSGWVPTGKVVNDVPEHACNPLLAPTQYPSCIVYRKVLFTFDYWGVEEIGNPTYVIALLFCLTAVLLGLTLWYLGLVQILIERGLPSVRPDTVAIYNHYRHLWSERRLVDGRETWQLLITWESVQLMAENPDLLDAFLEESGVTCIFDRANLWPLLSDTDFMHWQHREFILDTSKIRADRLGGLASRLDKAKRCWPTWPDAWPAFWRSKHQPREYRSQAGPENSL